MQPKPFDPQAIFNLAIAERMLAVAAPDTLWCIGDDLCDCIFQRIGEWKNPYLGRTLRVRMCCIWADLYKMYPQFVQELPYYDSNRHTYSAIPATWDSDEEDMPVSLWHRQLAIKEGKSVAEIRAEYAGRENERPKKVATRLDDTPTEYEIAYARRQQRIAAAWELP